MREIRTDGLMRGCWPERFVRRVGVYSTELLGAVIGREDLRHLQPVFAQGIQVFARLSGESVHDIFWELAFGRRAACQKILD